MMKKTTLFKMLMALGLAVMLLNGCGSSGDKKTPETAVPTVTGDNPAAAIGLAVQGGPTYIEVKVDLKDLDGIDLYGETGNPAPYIEVDGVKNPIYLSSIPEEHITRNADGVIVAVVDWQVIAPLPSNYGTKARIIMWSLNAESGEYTKVTSTDFYIQTAVKPATGDTIKPVITLTGGTTSMVVNGKYTAPTVKVVDNVDGDITSSIVKTGSVDTTKVGTYTIKYTVSDKAGNKAEKTHTVVVKDTPVVISTPTIVMDDQVVDDNAGSVATNMTMVLIEDVETGALYSIVSNPTGGKLTINASTGIATWLGDTTGPGTDYTITIKVENTDGGTDTTTFNVHVNNNA